MWHLTFRRLITSFSSPLTYKTYQPALHWLLAPASSLLHPECYELVTADWRQGCRGKWVTCVKMIRIINTMHDEWQSLQHDSAIGFSRCHLVPGQWLGCSHSPRKEDDAMIRADRPHTAFIQRQTSWISRHQQRLLTRLAYFLLGCGFRWLLLAFGTPGSLFFRGFLAPGLQRLWGFSLRHFWAPVNLLGVHILEQLYKLFIRELRFSGCLFVLSLNRKNWISEWKD